MKYREHWWQVWRKKQPVDQKTVELGFGVHMPKEHYDNVIKNLEKHFGMPLSELAERTSIDYDFHNHDFAED